ncbi:UNVERIFIED_CONTAM: hypothetical protein K2H54_004899 [Gekko kuhli]
MKRKRKSPQLYNSNDQSSLEEVGLVYPEPPTRCAQPQTSTQITTKLPVTQMGKQASLHNKEPETSLRLLRAQEQSKTRLSQPRDQQTVTSPHDPSKDMETEELPESLATLSTRATNRSSNCVLRLSPPVNLEKQYLNKNRPADPPELLEDDYELDSPHLFTIYSNKHLPSIVDSKSLAEELADAAKQAKTAQLELNRQIMAKTLPVMSTHKRVNGCVLEEQFAEEIGMASSSSGEATLGDTTPEGFQEPEHN